MSAPEHRGSHGGSMLLVVFHQGAPVPAAPATAPLAVKPGGCPALVCACVMSTHKDVVGETSLHLCLAAHMHARRIRPSASSEMQSSGLGARKAIERFAAVGTFLSHFGFPSDLDSRWRGCGMWAPQLGRRRSLLPQCSQQARSAVAVILCPLTGRPRAQGQPGGDQRGGGAGGVAAAVAAVGGGGGAVAGARLGGGPRGAAGAAVPGPQLCHGRRHDRAPRRRLDQRHAGAPPSSDPCAPGSAI